MRIRNRAPKNPYKRTTYGGKTFNWRTRAALMELSARLYDTFYALDVYQGSYNTSVGASGNTHAGGGAVDLTGNDWRKKVHVGREIGWRIWHRTPEQGDWVEHCHGILGGDEQMSSAAHDQIIAYANKRNGLANNAPDNFPHHPNGVHFNYQAWRKHYNRGRGPKR